jgi:hypothetical protein
MPSMLAGWQISSVCPKKLKVQSLAFEELHEQAVPCGVQTSVVDCQSPAAL